MSIPMPCMPDMPSKADIEDESMIFYLSTSFATLVTEQLREQLKKLRVARKVRLSLGTIGLSDCMLAPID